jgi:superfamily II DNA/RNA helicase
MPKILVFLSKKADCDELSELLCGRGLRADALHGDKPQASRMRVMDRFKTGQVRVLVATDVAGRGLDVKVGDNPNSSISGFVSCLNYRMWST